MVATLSVWKPQHYAAVIVVVAAAALARLRSPSPADVRAAQLAIDEAQASIARLSGPTELEIEAARHGVVQAQANLDRLLEANRLKRRAAAAAVAAAQAVSIFLADRLRKTVTRLDFGKDEDFDEDIEYEGERDMAVLARVHLAGKRFNRLLSQLAPEVSGVSRRARLAKRVSPGASWRERRRRPARASGNAVPAASFVRP